jgi:hypothetical protein
MRERRRKMAERLKDAAVTSAMTDEAGRDVARVG